MTIKNIGGVFGRNPDFNSVSSGAYTATSAVIVTESGTTRTLANSDNGKVIYATSGSAVTITVPSTLPVGFSCTVIQGGAGAVTFSAGAGATANSYGSFLTTAGQYAVASVVSAVAAEVVVTGQLV